MYFICSESRQEGHSTHSCVIFARAGKQSLISFRSLHESLTPNRPYRNRHESIHPCTSMGSAMGKRCLTTMESPSADDVLACVSNHPATEAGLSKSDKGEHCLFRTSVGVAHYRVPVLGVVIQRTTRERAIVPASSTTMLDTYFLYIHY